jgi:hypothetical protein
MLKVTRSKQVAFALIFSFLIFYYPHFLPAQAVGQGSLTGFIYGKDGLTPVKGAVVKLKNIVDGTIYESKISDSAGAFKIEGIEEGLYFAGISTPSGDFNFENFIGIKTGEPAKISFALDLSGAQSIPNPEEKTVSPPEEEFISTAEEQTSAPFQVGSEVTAPSGGVLIGKVVNYNYETQEASIFIEQGMMRVGDQIIFRGTETDFIQKVQSIRIESTEVNKASVGQTPDVLVAQPVDFGDFVYLKEKKKLFFFLSPVGVATVLAATGGIVYGIVKLTEEEDEVSAFKE